MTPRRESCCNYARARCLVSKLATNTCGEERKCVRVMDVKKCFFIWSCSTNHFHRGSHRSPKEPVGWSVGKSGGIVVRDTRCSNDLARLFPMLKESVGIQRITSHETKVVELIAHVDDLFVVGCLKHVQDVYHGLSDAFEMKFTYAGPKTGNSEVEYRRHRSAVARVVYMAQGRPDLKVVACTLAKTMAHPKIGDEWMVKRVCRYVKGRP